MNDEQKKLIEKEIEEYMEASNHCSINSLKQRLSDEQVAIGKLKQEIIQAENYVKKLKEGIGIVEEDVAEKAKLLMKHTLSDDIVVIGEDSYLRTPLVKEANKKFIEWFMTFDDKSVDGISQEEIRKKSKEIYGEKLI